MFTGIIETTAPVISVKKQSGMQVHIAKPRGWKLVKGQSVSIDGICSTIEDFDAKHFELTYMPETLGVTTAGSWKTRRIVNLERSMKVSDRLEGHIVQGHVDGVGVVKSIRIRGSLKEITIALPRTLLRFVTMKGSIAVNGVSLTVAARAGGMCTVALIPHTLKYTNLGALAQGENVNIETDLFARHLAALRGK